MKDLRELKDFEPSRCGSEGALWRAAAGPRGGGLLPSGLRVYVRHVRVVCVQCRVKTREAGVM